MINTIVNQRGRDGGPPDNGPSQRMGQSYTSKVFIFIIYKFGAFPLDWHTHIYLLLICSEIVKRICTMLKFYVLYL